MLKIAFYKMGWTVDAVTRPTEAARKLAETRYDLAIFEWRFPHGELSSTDLIRRVRKGAWPATRILVLAGSRHASACATAQQVGADDALTKATDLPMLLARVKTQLRLARQQQICAPLPGLTAAAAPMAEYQALQALTAREFAMLEYFAANTGRVVTREELRQQLWSRENEPSNPNTVDVYIGKLRKKLGNFGKMLRTTRGVGYVLEILS